MSVYLPHLQLLSSYCANDQVHKWRPPVIRSLLFDPFPFTRSWLIQGQTPNPSWDNQILFFWEFETWTIKMIRAALIPLLPRFGYSVIHWILWMNYPSSLPINSLFAYMSQSWCPLKTNELWSQVLKSERHGQRRFEYMTFKVKNKRQIGILYKLEIWE